MRDVFRSLGDVGNGIVADLAKQATLQREVDRYNSIVDLYRSEVNSATSQAAIQEARNRLDWVQEAVSGQPGFGGLLQSQSREFVARVALDELDGYYSELNVPPEDRLEITTAILDYLANSPVPKPLSPTSLSEAILGIQGPAADRFRDSMENQCFLAETQISMADGSTKAIEHIKVGDSVQSYDSTGRLVVGQVTKVFNNTSEKILDLHGLMITPGHVVLRGGPDSGNVHLPILTILREDGVIVDENGKQIRASTGCDIGSLDDTLIWAKAGVYQDDGTFRVDDVGQLRLGTKHIDQNGNVISVREIIENGDGSLEAAINAKPNAEIFIWPFGPSLPRPETYVLQRSHLSLLSVEDELAEGVNAFNQQAFAQAGTMVPTTPLTQSINASRVCYKTYNFEVAEYHTYIAEGIRVHNMSTTTTVIDFRGTQPGDDPAVTSAHHDESYWDVVVHNADGSNSYTLNQADEVYFNQPGTEPTVGYAGPSGGYTEYNGDSRPVIIDLDGDGIEVGISLTTAFDWDDDGFEEFTSWVNADDGFLVIDLNTDGTRGSGDMKIDQAKELAFALWGNAGDTDLQALGRVFDDNSDGVLDTQDSVWTELRIWQDLDQDGETVNDSGELKTLAQLGITQLNLIYDNGLPYTETSDDISFIGTTVFGFSSFIQNGVTVVGGIADLSLGYNVSGWSTTDFGAYEQINFETGEKWNVTSLEAGTQQDFVASSNGVALVYGDQRNNTIDASAALSGAILYGEDGDDYLIGSAWGDVLESGSGIDTVVGGAGNDVIYADSDDMVEGGTGYDMLVAMTSVPFVINDMSIIDFEAFEGRNGADLASASTSSHDVFLSGHGGADTLHGESVRSSVYE